MKMGRRRRSARKLQLCDEVSIRILGSGALGCVCCGRAYTYTICFTHRFLVSGDAVTPNLCACVCVCTRIQ